jgi:hypothetical protein
MNLANGANSAMLAAPVNSAAPAGPAAPGAPAGPASPAAPQGSQVIAGVGTNGSGDQCGCQCLCAAQVAAPPNVGLGAFGGIVGEYI